MAERAMTALILIDIQIGFNAPVWGERNNPGAEGAAGKLLQTWRERGDPIFHIRHVSVERGSPLAGPGAAFKSEVAPLPDEPILEKHVNSAFIGTDLETRLRGAAIEEVVICGLTTPHCVSTTTRMAANLGFRVFVAHDACAAFTTNANTTWLRDTAAPSADEIHRAALSHLHGEFAQVLHSTDLIAR
jgi:nicotinamidase-related amidase